MVLSLFEQRRVRICRDDDNELECEEVLAPLDAFLIYNRLCKYDVQQIAFVEKELLFKFYERT